MDTNHSGPTASSGSTDSPAPIDSGPIEPPVTPREPYGWRFWLLLGGLALVMVIIAIPNFVKARTTACHNACIGNLKQLDGAIQKWALHKKAVGTNQVDAVELLEFLKGTMLPACPANGTYSFATVSESPRCTQSAIGHSL
jgi:hypothetical protein